MWGRKRGAKGATRETRTKGVGVGLLGVAAFVRLAVKEG